MTTLSITQGQEKQLKRFLEDSVVGAVHSALAQMDLNKDGAQLIIERGDELKSNIERMALNILKKLSLRYPVLAETGILKPVDTATVPERTKPFDAAAFYQTGTNLYVFDTFASRFDLSTKQVVHSAPERPYVASLLKANAYDRDIRKELPETHLSMLEDIAALIEAQPGGKPGFLLTNGYANIFYVEGKNGEVFTVDVYWYSDGRRWCVRDWRLVEYARWGADSQVLCPGNASL